LPSFAGRFSVPILDLRCLVLGTVVIEGWANVDRPLHCSVVRNQVFVHGGKRRRQRT
jgi:hypothetical protein